MLLRVLGKWGWVISGLFLAHLSYGNPVAPLNIDSLKREIAVQVEQNQLNALLQSYETLGRFYFQENRFDEAINCYTEGLRLGRRLGDLERQFFFLHYLGSMYFYPKDEYQKSLDYLEEAQKLVKQLPEGKITAEQIVRNEVKLAEVYNTIGDVEQAFAHQIVALDLAEANEDTFQMAVGYRILGVIHGHQNQFKSSLQFFKQAYRLHQTLDDPYQSDSPESREIAYNYFTTLASIGATFLELDSLDAALHFIGEASLLADSIDHAYGQAYCKALLGSYFLMKKSYDDALTYLKECVDMFKSLGLRQECAVFSLQIANLYTEQAEYWAALQSLDRAETDALSLVHPRLMQDIYQKRSEVNEKLGRVGEAFTYYKKYVQYRDSLVNEDRLSSLTTTNLEQQQAVKEQQEQIQTLQKANDSTKRLAIWIGLSLIVIFLAVILLITRNRNKDLKAINLILNQKNEEIRLQNERLASSNEDLRQFAHVTSHDLREPLRSIGSFASLLRRRYKGRLDEEADEFISFIEKGVQRMDKLLGDLLAYSMAGIFQHKLELVDVKEVITLIISRLHQEKRLHGVKVTLRELPIIRANRVQIIQLFSQLIDNAIKFRSEEKPQILIRAESRGNVYLFSVQDNGIGMADEYRDKIFGLFLRLHTRKSKYQGTGVGLSICKKIVEQHQGKIWIESEEGKGTTVFFSLPDDPTPKQLAKQTKESVRQHAKSGSSHVDGETSLKEKLVKNLPLSIK